jgi:hypothetical protein
MVCYRINVKNITEIIHSFVCLRIYMGYIGDFGWWFEDMTNILCSSQGVGTKNAAKGYKLAIQQLFKEM